MYKRQEGVQLAWSEGILQSEFNRIDAQSFWNGLHVPVSYTHLRLGQYKEEEKRALQEIKKKKPKNILKNKVPVRKQPPEERRRNFQEVSFGYCLEEALMEAERCLQCKNCLLYTS